VPGGRWRSGFAAATTNQRMELQAVLDACQQLEGRLSIVSDSTYVVNCWRDRWYEGWLKKGWLNSQKQPVANRDLWEPLIAHFQSQRLIMTWVKGHSGDPMNDLVDRLAVRATIEQHGAEGERPPEGGVEAAGPTDAIAEKVDRIAGHPVLVAGLRPQALGGYDRNALADRVADLLKTRLLAEKLLHPDLVVVSGMDLGASTMGIEAAAALGVPYVCALAYPDVASVWPQATQQRHRSLVAGAREVINVGRKQPTSKQQAGAALARRDDWLGKHVDAALVVWDGRDEPVGKLVRKLEERLGSDNVQVVEP
jgi:ribonuclease HI